LATSVIYQHSTTPLGTTNRKSGTNDKNDEKIRKVTSVPGVGVRWSFNALQISGIVKTCADCTSRHL